MLKVDVEVSELRWMLPKKDVRKGKKATEDVQMLLLSWETEKL